MNSRAARVENIVTALREREGVRGRQVEGTHRHRFLIVCPIAFCPRLSFPKSCSPQSLHPTSHSCLSQRPGSCPLLFGVGRGRPLKLAPPPHGCTRVAWALELPRKDLKDPHSLCWTAVLAWACLSLCWARCVLLVPLNRVLCGTCPPPTAVSLPGKEG